MAAGGRTMFGVRGAVGLHIGKGEECSRQREFFQIAIWARYMELPFIPMGIRGNTGAYPGHVLHV